jgi:hypothetical protein
MLGIPDYCSFAGGWNLGDVEGEEGSGSSVQNLLEKRVLSRISRELLFRTPWRNDFYLPNP